MTDSTQRNSWIGITTSRSAGQNNYNELRSRYVALANDAVHLFSTDYDRQFTKLEHVVKNVSALAVPPIFAAIDDAIATLASHRIFDIDREHFAATYFKQYDKWSAAHEAIAEAYAGVLINAAEMDTYRAARSQGGAQVIGGGFGVDGAAQGIVIAGAANLAISATHSLFNLIAKGASAAADAKKMDDIFRAPETKGRLVAALEESLLNVHLALLDALEEAKVADTNYEQVTIADRERAKRMLTNIIRGQVPSAERESVHQQVLKLNPYDLDAYTYALDSIGDAQGDIERVADFFHLDLRQEKRDRIAILCTGSTEEAITEAIRKVGDAGQWLGVPIEDEYLTPLRERLRLMDEAARLVDGRLYPTRDAARAEESRIRDAEARVKADAAKATAELDAANFKTVEIGEAARQIAKYLVFALGVGAVGLLGSIPGKHSPEDSSRLAPLRPESPASDALSVEFSGKSTIKVRDATNAVVYAGEYSAPHIAVIKGKPPFEISVGAASNVQFSRPMPGQEQGFPIDLIPDSEGHVVAQKVQ